MKKNFISPERFSGLMSLLGIDFSKETDLAVAVSGGGDSLALTFLLSGWIKDKNIKLHALTVDHGLRDESAAEARKVSRILKPFSVNHKILKWEGTKPSSRIQEMARDARYRLMSEYCTQCKIKYLFIAHHGQDQMETILFRLAKGTGLDGLAGMQSVQISENGLTLLRPLLSTSHEQLLDVLKDHNIEWIEDPSNHNDRYARVRIRNVINVLEKEGLSSERISTLSTRIHQSVHTIDYLIEKEYKSLIIIKDTQRIEINYEPFSFLPIDGKVRILKLMLCDLHPHKKYPARLEDIERLAYKMGNTFKASTLGGCLFRKKKQSLVVSLESKTS